ncbi:hypothetical protein G6M17_07815 [Agrobacterium tumefaciens]|uniref:hypothetical protein n=1 Tax=Rhizobium/Agrobacterium group TaxID=227290 RepID=UPI0009986E6A|nr:MULTISPECIES: hypothetical protein [Rhizobium/Agrobacterium group]AQS61710.2 hypothetical protein B0909_05195 [Rhizobium rhizogenes]MCZ7443068.1 hypothetical protein [Rhizobium rhizogenes]NSZ79054.1 hypothetical protein [Agrobacterium tumefaciens]
MIRYEVPTFLVQTEARDYVHARPSLDLTVALDEWMKSKYLAWIEDKIGEPADFVTDTGRMFFDISFDDETLANAFLKKLGGKVH